MHIRLLPAMMTAVVLVVESLAMRSTVQRTAPEPAQPNRTAVSTPEQTTPPTGRPTESVLLSSEIVTARLVPSAIGPTARVARAAPHNGPPQVRKRSLFARVVLGNGDSRPQPFPRPGS